MAQINPFLGLRLMIGACKSRCDFLNRCLWCGWSSRGFVFLVHTHAPPAPAAELQCAAVLTRREETST